MVQYFDEDKVRTALDSPELVDAMTSAFVAISEKSHQAPLRQQIHVPATAGTFYLMPAIASNFVVKLVSNFPRNATLGIDTHNGLVLIFDTETGVPKAILDAASFTAFRTAAVSAASARLLAPNDATILAILGSGVQARSHARFLRHVRNFSEIRIWSRNRESAKKLADEVGGVCADAEDVVRGADVICTTTASSEPVLNGKWLKPGSHVCAVGWNGIAGGELDDEVMQHTLLVESREAALAESGNIIRSSARISAEIGEVLSGSAKVDASAITVFISVGHALEDAFAAELALKRLNQ